MFNLLDQIGQAVETEKQAQVWLPSDTAPSMENFPNPQEAIEMERWEDDGGRPYVRA